MKIVVCLFGALICFIFESFGQVDSTTLDVAKLSDRVFKKIQKNASGYDEVLTRQSEKYLQRLSDKEQDLQKKLYSRDSVAANTIFSGSAAKYNQLISKISSASGTSTTFPLHEYIPGIDSTQAVLNFLKKEGSDIPGMSQSKLANINLAAGQLQNLQAKLQSANEIDQFIKLREQQLKDALSQYGYTKEIMAINKEAYYYQQQLAEYKNLLHDPDKMEEKVLSEMQNVQAFKQFFQKNSYLSQLFGLPDNYSSVTTLDGLQTRAQVDKLVSNSLGSQGNGGGANPEQFASQQIQQAQSLINQLKSKLNSIGNSGGGGDLVTPDGFAKNNQKTKSFLKRLEYGFDVQAEPTTNFLPASAALAALVGYKLNDKVSFGVGLSYRLGLGTGFSHIQLSNQGAGIRSYVDAKIKGNIYFTGGIECNFLEQFKSFQSIDNLDIWQKSALFGLSKKTKIGKNKQSTFEILFDALYKQHTPASSPVVFRMGYQF